MGEDSPKYDLSELERLWDLPYEELARAPGAPGAHIREARYVMQAKVAHETRTYMVVTTAATIVMAISTLLQAIGIFLR